jgi:hypothetical protein
VLHCADVAPTVNAHFGDKQGLENQHINGGGALFVPVPYFGDRETLRRRNGDADSYQRGSLC